MATAVEAPQTQFLTLDLAKITPSPMNPRKRFDEKALKELADSIKAHGVQQPIVVRPNGKQGQYEIVVGERRYRASKLAGRKDIPAIVNQLSDAAALEVMVIENLQREDVHPLDEALGYEALMKRKQETDPELGELPGAPQHTAESIAAKVGKSIGYVYARLKLLALIPVAREAFEKDYITPGHAVLIARLEPTDQVRALDACFHSYGNDRELKKLDPKTVTLDDMDIDPLRDGLLPEKALREWIQENVNLRLKDVPWDLEDAELVPQAGPCSTCLKRSTSNPALFAELAIRGEDTCFDAACFQAKRKAFVQLTIKQDKAAVREKNAPQEKADAPVKEIEKPFAQPMLQLSDLPAYTKPKPDQAVYRAGQWLPAKLGSCANVRKGIMVRGEEAGQTKYVCIEASCKVHKHNLERATSSRGGSEFDYDEQNFQRHRQRILDSKRGRVRAIVCKAIVEEIGAKLPVEILREAAAELIESRDTEISSWLLGEPKPLAESKFVEALKKAEGARLNQMLTAFLLARIGCSTWNVQEKELRDFLVKLAKQIGVKNPARVMADAEKAVMSARHCRACGCTEKVPCEYWDGSTLRHCSWKEQDLCSNPECAKHDAKAKNKKASGGKEVAQ